MAGDANEPGRNQGDHDSEAFQRRLDDLGERLATARGKKAPAGASPQGRGDALGQALRLGAELIGGVLVGAFVGWWLDWLFGTAPLFLVLLLVLGAAAGIINVMRTAKAMQPKGPLPGHDLPDDDDDE